MFKHLRRTIWSQLDNLILDCDTASMKNEDAASSADQRWQKNQFSNLVRYVPSGTYFARVRIHGKLIRKSLKTNVLTVAKLRLADFEKSERQSARAPKQIPTPREGSLLLARHWGSTASASRAL